MVFNLNVYEVRRGDRQGDPLSAYLVTIALELLLIIILHPENIGGSMVEKRDT